MDPFTAMLLAVGIAPESKPAERIWEFRGSKDPEISQLMTAHLGRAQKLYDEVGPDLAKEFKMELDPTVRGSVQFYDTSGDITAERIRQKRGMIGAYTQPGSRAIRLPGRNLAGMDEDFVNNLVLHELMHSSGLKEDRGESDKIQSIVNNFMKRRRKEREKAGK